MARAFRKVHTTNKDVQLLQDAVKGSLDTVTSSPLLNGHLIKAVSLKAGSNNVSHGLGRNYLSVLPGIPSAASTLTLAQSPNAALICVVVATAPCVVDLFVF